MSYDEGEMLIATQESAIEELKRLLENNKLPVDNDKMIEMLVLTGYDPNQAFELLEPPLELTKPSDKINPLKNRRRTQKLTQSLDTSAASTKSIKNRTRKNIVDAREYVIQQEKQDLESKLPEYLNGAKLDIIERDDHYFYRSITNQLLDYGFSVPDEYQTVRNLIADYIDSKIPVNIITAESPSCTSKKEYTDAIRQTSRGDTLEIKVVHDGCLNSLTRGQAFKIIVYIIIDNEIKLHPGFLQTMPNDEKSRWPIRLIYVGNYLDFDGYNHFHRIYFDDLDKQKQYYVGEANHYSITQSPSRNNSMWSPRNEMSPREIEAQKQAFEQFNKGRKIVEIDENSDEYGELLVDNLNNPFMVMGYQNGESNILYKTKLIRGCSGDGIERFAAYIYVPKDLDKNNRKYTRYPNPTMLNVDKKTIVNISLHKWANIWDDNNNIPLSNGSKALLIHMSEPRGVEEVIGTEDADFISITEKEKEISYERHGERGMSFSPDTGVIALDNEIAEPSCVLYVTDPTDGRKLIFFLKFFREFDDYNNHRVFSEDNKSGGKSRRRRITRKLRRNKRRQTKRRHAKRAFKLTQ